MTTGQTMFTLAILAACLVALVLMTIGARPEKENPGDGKGNDREKILCMLAKVGDQSSLAPYLKAYDIEVHEIEEKRKALAP